MESDSYKSLSNNANIQSSLNIYYKYIFNLGTLFALIPSSRFFPPKTFSKAVIYTLFSDFISF